jgi:hypothetical protein
MDILLALLVVGLLALFFGGMGASLGSEKGRTGLGFAWGFSSAGGGRTLANEAPSPPGFFDLTLREIFSPTRALVCHLAEKNATRSDKKEEVGAASYKPPLPPALWGFRKKDN